MLFLIFFFKKEKCFIYFIYFFPYYLKISFQASFIKTYTIPKGIIEQTTDITTKDFYTGKWINLIPYFMCKTNNIFRSLVILSYLILYSEAIVFLHSNTGFLGMYNENYFEFKRYGLEHCYISSGNLLSYMLYIFR